MEEKVNRQRSDTAKAHDENQQFISQLMPPPPNRVPQYGQELIEMAANQSIAEEADNNGGVEVVKKVNINFGTLKINDSKKRLRPNEM